MAVERVNASHSLARGSQNAPSSDEGAEQLAILVFKSNHSARTFRVPQKWITRLGIILGCCAAATLVSLFFAARYYYTAQTASPAKIRDLEKELDDLKNRNQTLETKLVEAKSAAPAPNLTPAPTDTLASAQQPPNTSQVTAVTASLKSSLFGALPPSATTAPPPDKASLPFSLTEPTTTWRTSGLRVHFAIQYTKGDGGNQQGRIILLARGPGKLLAYPAGCLNLSGSDSLIQPDRGEYFSVSRFREVNADFGPVARHDEIKDVEVLIFNVAGGLIFAEKLATKLNPTSGEKTQ